MTPILLIPGLNSNARFFRDATEALWAFGPVTIAETLEGDTVDEMAAAVLRDAPPRFALAGYSMGGYIAFAILRQAPERVTRLALIDTSARPDSRRRPRCGTGVSNRPGQASSASLSNNPSPAPRIRIASATRR